MDTNGARAYATPGAQERSPADAFRRLQQHVGALQAYVTHFVSAKVDGFILSARQLALWAALGVVGLTAAVGLVVTAVVLVLVGAAEGFALLFGGRGWLGALVVGGGPSSFLLWVSSSVCVPGTAGGASRRCTSMTNASASNRQPSDTALRTGLQQHQHDNTDDARVFFAQHAADATTAIRSCVTHGDDGSYGFDRQGVLSISIHV